MWKARIKILEMNFFSGPADLIWIALKEVKQRFGSDQVAEANRCLQYRDVTIGAENDLGTVFNLGDCPCDSMY